MRWFLLFILVPLTDLYLLLLVARWMGFFETLALVILTGITGAWLARRQGFRVLRAVQRDLQEGRMPTDHLLSGLLVLVGGVLLLTPGLLTDCIGFLLMIPGNRRLLGGWLRGALGKHFRIQPFPPLSGMGGPGAFGPRDVGEARVVEEDDDGTR